MPNFTYQLSFAGVPLLEDMGSCVVRPNVRTQFGREEDTGLLAKKFQPLPDLLDEINRLLRLGAIKDQSYVTSYTNRNVSELARKFPFLDWTTLDPQIGDWFYPWGASRWGIFRGLATSSMVRAILNVTGGGNPASFVMQAVPSNATDTSNQGDPALYTLTSNLFMLPPRPLAEHGGGFDGLYLITLVDERFYWQGVSSSIRVDQDTTWVQILTQLAGELNINLTVPTIPTAWTSPESDSQLWANQESSALLLDAASYNLGLNLVRHLDGTYELVLADTSRNRIVSNRLLLGPPGKNVERLAGGNLFPFTAAGSSVVNLASAKNSILPTSVLVNFPKYVTGNDPVPHYSNTRYANQRQTSWYEDSYGETFSINVPLVSGTSGGILAGQISGATSPTGIVSSGLVGTPGFVLAARSTAKALYLDEASTTNGVPINLPGLTALAQQVTNDVLTARADAALDEVYPGTFAWTPEGIHDMIWSYSTKRRLASTRVLKSQWNRSVPERQNATPIPTYGVAPAVGSPVYSGNQQTSIPPGAGGHSVSQTWRDSFSGSVTTTLAQTYTSGQGSVTLNSPGCFPTQNRWRGLIEQEILLFEGTSGGTSVSVVYQGIDGTIPKSHPNGSVISLLTPDTTYGVNLVTYEKGQFAYPQDWTSGGIQGVNIVPQTQTVQVLDGAGVVVNGQTYYSGQVNLWDTSPSNPTQLNPLEYVYLLERNNKGLSSGGYYDGQFVGTSCTNPSAPLYALTQNVGVLITLNFTNETLIFNNTVIDVTGPTYFYLYAPIFINPPPGTVTGPTGPPGPGGPGGATGLPGPPGLVAKVPFKTDDWLFWGGSTKNLVPADLGTLTHTWDDWLQGGDPNLPVASRLRKVVWRIDPTGAGGGQVILTGIYPAIPPDITDPLNGQVLVLLNISTNYHLIIRNDDSGSLAFNRIYTPGSFDLYVEPGGGVGLWYDWASLHWRVFTMEAGGQTNLTGNNFVTGLSFDKATCTLTYITTVVETVNGRIVLGM